MRDATDSGWQFAGESITQKRDAVVVMMADESDDCRDVARYWKLLNEGFDCVFGSRFIKGGGVVDYPWLKLKLNRFANLFIRLCSGLSSTTRRTPSRPIGERHSTVAARFFRRTSI